MGRVIIDNRADMDDAEAIRRALVIIDSGRVSGAGDKAQYCYHSVFSDGIHVSAFLNKGSDRLVVYKEREGR